MGRVRTLRLTAFVLGLFAAMPGPARAQQPMHPLDGLTMTEHWRIFDVLKGFAKVDADTQYPQIVLREPPKAEVMSWRAGTPFRREALVVVRQRKQTFEAIVDVAQQKIPRPEDFPVMPTAWHEFTLRPVDFFSRNPALDLPKAP